MTSVSGHLLAHDFQMQFRKWSVQFPGEELSDYYSKLRNATGILRHVDLTAELTILGQLSRSFQTALTKCHQLEGLVNDRNLFLPVLAAGSRGSGYQHSQVKGSLPHCTANLSPWPHL